MATVKMSSYSPTGTNWTPAMLTAYNALQAVGGGTLLCDVPILKMETALTMNTHGDLPLCIKGDGSSRIWFAGTGLNNWIIGSCTWLRFEDLVMHGDDTAGTGTTVDCANALTIASSVNVVFRNVIMCGIRPSGNVLSIQTTKYFKMIDCELSGNGGGTLDIQTTDHVELDNVKFIDYLAIFGFRSKVGDGASWAKIYNPPPGVVGERRTSVTIRNCGFDEASAVAIYIQNYQHVIIDQPRINVGSYGYAIAISLDGVEHAIIRQPHIGYNNADRPIVKTINGGITDVIGCGKDDNVAAPNRLVRDAGTILKNLQKKSGIIESVL